MINFVMKGILKSKKLAEGGSGNKRDILTLVLFKRTMQGELSGAVSNLN